MKTQELRFAALIRVSTEKQEEHGESLQTQESQLRQYVSALGGILIEPLYAGQQHATQGYETPLLNRLLIDAENHLFDAVIVTDASRWSRDSMKNLAALEVLRRNGILFFIGTTEHNLNDPSSKFMLTILAAANQLEAELRAYKSVINRVERAKRGWPSAGTLPFGRRVNVHGKFGEGEAIWELIPAAKEHIDEIFDRYVNRGQTLGEIARALTWDKRPLNYETVRRRLENCGPWFLQRFKISGEIQIVRTPIPPLLSEEQLLQVKERAKTNQTYREPKHDYPLSHIVRCANCGSNFSGHTSTYEGSSYRYYRHLERKVKPGCVRSIRADELEKEIFYRLGNLLGGRNELRVAIETALQKGTEKSKSLEHEIEGLRRERTRIAKNREKLLNAVLVLDFEKDPATRDSLQKRIQEIGDRTQSLKDRESDLHRVLGLHKVPQDFKERIDAALFKLIGLHGAAPLLWPPTAKQDLARLFFGRKTRGMTDLGIFVASEKDETFEVFWTYQAKGLIGTLNGVVSDYEALHEMYTDQNRTRSLTEAEMAQLMQTLESVPIWKRKFRKGEFRVSHDGRIHWSGSRSR